ncbi:MAG: hypothetical protein LRY35_05025 [Clostridiales bacterium]|nr:hypothetical protein [Clostridiales bacterium]
MNNNALVVNLAPILVEGRIDGAILTCHKVKKLEKLPSDLLRERYLMGLVARAISTRSRKIQQRSRTVSVWPGSMPSPKVRS